MKKTIYSFILMLCLPTLIIAQENYVDFEKTNMLSFGTYTGKLDTMAQNPKPDEVNKTTKCAKYVRDKNIKYDNIKIYPKAKLRDVSKYASHEGFPSKISLKLHTNAPVGTLIELQLGNKMTSDYPSGINSQFQTFTTVQNQWEELVFTFSEIPVGSMVSSNDVDMIIVMFAPNTMDGSTYYFDDLMGPEINLGTEQTKKTSK